MGRLIRVAELMTVWVVVESGSGYDGGPTRTPGGGSPRVLIGQGVALMLVQQNVRRVDVCE